METIYFGRWKELNLSSLSACTLSCFGMQHDSLLEGDFWSGKSSSVSSTKISSAKDLFFTFTGLWSRPTDSCKSDKQESTVSAKVTFTTIPTRCNPDTESVFPEERCPTWTFWMNSSRMGTMGPLGSEPRREPSSLLQQSPCASPSLIRNSLLETWKLSSKNTTHKDADKIKFGHL